MNITIIHFTCLWNIWIRFGYAFALSSCPYYNYIFGELLYLAKPVNLVECETISAKMYLERHQVFVNLGLNVKQFVS